MILFGYLENMETREEIFQNNVRNSSEVTRNLLISVRVMRHNARARFF